MPRNGGVEPMKVRVNPYFRRIIYITPESEEEKQLLKKAWDTGSLSHHITSFSSSGELGVKLD
jgi:hypothetical protein